MTIRPYSPINRGNIGVVEFAIKRYENGLFSKFLHDNLRVGDSVEMKGPIGTYQYIPNKNEHITMIAGGNDQNLTMHQIFEEFSTNSLGIFHVGTNRPIIRVWYYSHIECRYNFTEQPF